VNVVSDRAVHATSLGRLPNFEEVPTLVARAFGKTDVMFAEFRGDILEIATSIPWPRQDAFLLVLQLTERTIHEGIENDRRADVCDLRAGATVFFDLSRDPQVRIDRTLHSIVILVPGAAFDALADEIGAERIGELSCRLGIGQPDQIILNLCMSILPELRRAARPNRLLVDHIARALVGYIASTYGGLDAPSRLPSGRLAPWQERRAKEMLGTDLTANVTLEEVARACRLSVSHFSRAFRRSTGLAPHSWLLKHRVETAKKLLRNEALTLSDVALECGFADQSHFTHVFSREIGTSPGAWRRCVPARKAEGTHSWIASSARPAEARPRCRRIQQATLRS
jgi:AraC-like DNA-binding protein